MRFVAVVLFLIGLVFGEATNAFAAGEISGSRVAQLLNETYVENNPEKAIAALNSEFEKSGWQAGGQSDKPFLVPAKSVLWGDLSTIRLPDDELFPLLINEQSRVGVYLALVDVTIPSGRFIRTDLSLCRDMPEWWGFCQQDGGSTTVVTPASQAAPATSVAAFPADRICPQVRNASDPGQAIAILDALLQGEGYFYGGELSPGSTIPAGSIFWTNFGSNSGWIVNVDFVPLKNSGPWGAFRAIRDLKSPTTGRFLLVTGPTC